MPAARWVRVFYIDEIPVVFQELDARDRMIREVGLDEAGVVVHRCPDERFEDGRYGLDYPPPLDDATEISAEEFAEQWTREINPPQRVATGASRSLISRVGCLMVAVAGSVIFFASGMLRRS